MRSPRPRFIRCARIAEAGRLVEVAARVQLVIVVEDKGRTVKIITSGFTDKIDDRSRIPAIFSEKLVGHDSGFLNGIRIVQRYLASRNTWVVDVLTVDHKVVR